LLTSKLYNFQIIIYYRCRWQKKSILVLWKNKAIEIQAPIYYISIYGMTSLTKIFKIIVVLIHKCQNIIENLKKKFEFKQSSQLIHTPFLAVPQRPALHNKKYNITFIHFKLWE